MRYFITSAVFLFFLNVLVFAQEETSSDLIDKDKQTFEENVFNKEHGTFRDTSENARKLYDRIPEELPGWVFTPVEYGNVVRLMAASDPNMEKEDAVAMAVLRAKALFALLDSSMVSNITDDYTNLKEKGKYALYSTKFQDFSLTKTRFAYNNSTIQVLDTFFTKYDEALVLIEVNAVEDSLKRDTIEMQAEHMQIFIERNFKNEKIEFFNFSVHDHLYDNDSAISMTQYNYRIVNRGYDIYSSLGNKQIEFKERTYNYRTNLEFVKDSTDSDLKNYRLSFGLWNACLTGILSNITSLSKQLASQVKNSNDFYTLKNEGLIRTVARNKIKFGFNKFEMIENNFIIDLNGRIIY